VAWCFSVSTPSSAPVCSAITVSAASTRSWAWSSSPSSANGEILGLDRLSGGDRPGRHHDGDLLQASLTGLLLGLVDEEERGPAGRQSEDDADQDDPAAALARITVFHLH
jgi:hypothetical protein